MPTSGFSCTTAGLSCAELTNAENSRLAPAIIDRSVIVAIFIITNSGNRYAGRVEEVLGSLNDGRHDGKKCCSRRRRHHRWRCWWLDCLFPVGASLSERSGERGDADEGDSGEFICGVVRGAGDELMAQSAWIRAWPLATGHCHDVVHGLALRAAAGGGRRSLFFMSVCLVSRHIHWSSHFPAKIPATRK